MPNTSIQGLRLQSVRDLTEAYKAGLGTPIPADLQLGYEGEFHILFDMDGIAAGPFSGRFILWLQDRLSSSTASLPGLMQEFAEDKGVYNWNAVADMAP